MKLITPSRSRSNRGPEVYRWLRRAQLLVLVAVLVLAAGVLSTAYKSRDTCENCGGLEQIASYLKSKIFPSGTMMVHEVYWKNPEDEHGDSLEQTILPVFDYNIPKKSMKKLLGAIPVIKETDFNNYSLPDFDWPRVPVTVVYNGRVRASTLRYRGWYYDHYRLKDKKSWRVRFKKSQLLNGLRDVNIINQRTGTSAIIDDVFQYELLKRHDFFVAQQKLVHLRLNGKFVGVQTYLEQPDNYLLTRYNLPVGPIYGEKAPFMNWKNYSSPDWWEIHAGETPDFEPMARFISTIKEKGTPQFKNAIKDILDVENYLSYLADAAITVKANPSSHNNRLYYDPKKGLFQILPWYQMGYFYQSSAPENRRGFYYVLNDVAHGLFLVPEYLAAYQRQTWHYINSTYHPDVLIDLIDQMIAAYEPDILADAYFHDITNQRYLTNRLWRERVKIMKKNILRIDAYIRRTLAHSTLDWTWRSTEAVPGNPGSLIGELKLNVKSLVAPRVEKICIEFSDAIRAGSTLSLTQDDGDAVYKAQVVSGDRKACLQIGRDFPANAEGKSDENLHGSGMYVTGFKSNRGVRMVAREKEYTLRLTASNGTPLVKRVTLSAVNSVTGAPLNQPIEEVVAASLRAGAAKDNYYKFSPDIDRHDTFQPSIGAKVWNIVGSVEPTLEDVVWPSGSYIRINEDMVLGAGKRLIIESGTVVELAIGKSLLIQGALDAQGTEERPIIFRSVSDTEPFGSIIITNTRERKNILRNVIIKNGSSAQLRGVSYLGALAVYASDALIDKVRFEETKGGDALNAVYSNTIVSNSMFLNNADCIDYDFSSGEIINSRFENCADDAIDVSHSNTKIAGNTIVNTRDKGVSVGEKSQPVISGNIIKRAAIGIAVKDLSTPRIFGNEITESDIGISLYVKKPEFGPPTAYLGGNILRDNQDNVLVYDGANVVKDPALGAQR